MALPYAKKKPHSQFSIKDKYYNTSICQKKTPHPILNKKDTSITPIPFAKKKPHTQSSIEKTQVLHQFHLSKKNPTPNPQ
jgi:hypothetical protein